MANAEQQGVLRRAVDEWNQWRRQNPAVRIDLTGADLAGAVLRRADLTGADLGGARLDDANLSEARLAGAGLQRASLQRASLIKADVAGADLSEARLYGADLTYADLTGANLTGVNLFGVILVRTNLTRAKLRQCRIYGLSAWDVELEGAEQADLVITPLEQPTITVDNLKVAQFVYLLLNNPQAREIIDTVAAKAVLILGRFTPERKSVLDAVRDRLRELGYVPIMFDFERPEDCSYVETVSILTHLARFIVADVTDAKVILQELERVVPALPSVPVQPIVQAGSDVNAVVLDFVGRLNFIESSRFGNPTACPRGGETHRPSGRSPFLVNYRRVNAAACPWRVDRCHGHTGGRDIQA